MIILRSIVFNIVFYTAFVGLMVVGLPFLLISRRATLVFVRAWARTSVALLRVICGQTIEFRNVHLVPKGASILAIKHQSFLETFALITVLDDFSYIMKKELLALPVFGWYVRATEQIGLDRERGGKAIVALQKAVRDQLALGRQIVIFPEGTRRRVGAAPAYKAGVAKLCSAAAVPCTPVALNTGLFWPRRTFIRRPGTVIIEFLPALPTGGGRKAFMDALQAAIEPATDALVAEARARDPDLDRAVAKMAAPSATTNSPAAA